MPETASGIRVNPLDILYTEEFDNWLTQEGSQVEYAWSLPMLTKLSEFFKSRNRRLLYTGRRNSKYGVDYSKCRYYLGISPTETNSSLSNILGTCGVFISDYNITREELGCYRVL